MGAGVLLEEVLFELLGNHLVADVPFGVVVARVGAGVEFGVGVLGDGVVHEAELDLGEGEAP